MKSERIKRVEEIRYQLSYLTDKSHRPTPGNADTIIALALNDIPWLLSVIDSLTAENEALTRNVDELKIAITSVGKHQREDGKE